MSKFSILPVPPQPHPQEDDCWISTKPKRARGARMHVTEACGASRSRTNTHRYSSILITGITLDAIDERPSSTATRTPSPKENVLKLVEWLSGLHCSHLSICVTSRPEADIEAVLLPLTSHVVSLHDENGQTEDTINYIKWFINSDPKARKWRNEDKELVLKKLSERADGM
jgi:hypothetical protein